MVWEHIAISINFFRCVAASHVFLLQALQALAVVLRGAHDDSHPFAAQCRDD